MLLVEVGVKKILIGVVGILLLAGCDDNKPQPPKSILPESKLSISEMISASKEERVSECKSGSESLNCEFLGGDLLGSGKWHHSKLFIHNNGKIDLVIDGNPYYQVDSSNSTYAGNRYTNFEMKGLRDEATATITITNSNDGKSLSFEGMNSEGAKFVIGNISLK